MTQFELIKKLLNAIIRKLPDYLQDADVEITDQQ